MRALVTGATGFAGSHLVEHLVAEGDDVLALGRRAAWEPTVARRVAESVEPLAWDIAHDPPADVRAAIERFQPQAIYHLAAQTVPRDCGAEQPTPQARATNVDGVGRVLDIAARLAVRPRVLLTSSCHVYAPVDADSPVVLETFPLGPTSGYGRTKLAAERLALDAAQQGLDVLVARAFHHTGPRQNDRMMLPEWCRQLAAGADPLLVQTLDAWLDLSDVRDVVRAYRLLVLGGAAGECYNVGSGIARHSGELLWRLLSLADADARIQETSPGRRQQPVAENAKLLAATRWRPRMPLDQTLADTYAYWRSRPA